MLLLSMSCLRRSGLVAAGQSIEQSAILLIARNLRQRSDSVTGVPGGLEQPQTHLCARSLVTHSTGCRTNSSFLRTCRQTCEIEQTTVNFDQSDVTKCSRFFRK